MNGADFMGCWQSIIFIRAAIFFHPGSLRMHVPSWFHICGSMTSTPSFALACRPGDLEDWSGFNYMHVLSVPTLHCSRHRRDALLWYWLFQILPFPSGTPRKILSGEIVAWDILTRKMPVGWGQRASLASDVPLGLQCSGDGGFDPFCLHHPLIWFTRCRAAGLEAMRKCRAVITSIGFGVRPGFKAWLCLFLPMWSWTSCCFHFLGLNCLMCTKYGQHCPCFNRADVEITWENGRQCHPVKHPKLLL